MRTPPTSKTTALIGEAIATVDRVRVIRGVPEVVIVGNLKRVIGVPPGEGVLPGPRMVRS